MGESETVDFIIPVSSLTVMSNWAQTILTIGNCIVFVFAICGNVIAIVIICRSRLSKMSTKLHLLTLASSDIILAMAAIPVDLGLLTSQYHSWILGAFVCENVSYFQTMAVMLNAFCLLAIALERYLSVTKSFGNPIAATTRRTYLPYLGLSLVWIIPIVTVIPQFWSYNLYSYKTYNDLDPLYNASDVEVSDKTYFMCFQPEEATLRTNAIFYTTTGSAFVAILIGFLFCYLSIIKFIQAHGTKFKRTQTGLEVSTPTATAIDSGGSRLPGSTSSSSNNRHQRTIRLIITLILIFCVCRVPVWSFLIVANLTAMPGTKETLTLMLSLHLLSNVNTALSPLMYAIWNKSLRVRGPKNGSICSKFSCFSFSYEKKSNERLPLSLFVIRPMKQNHYDLTTHSKEKHQEKGAITMKKVPESVRI